MSLSTTTNTGHVLWHSGRALSDVQVHVVVEGGTEAEAEAESTVLHLHSVVLTAASSFFAARLSPTWTRPEKTSQSECRIAFKSVAEARAATLALELLYTNAFDETVNSVASAVDLLKAFSFLGADAAIDRVSRYLAKECIRKRDIHTLIRLKEDYPLSSFFSDTNGVLSSSMVSAASTATKSHIPPTPTNSMTVEDLGVLIAKSCTKAGLKYMLFVQTELQENERLQFSSSNGVALIHGFETVLMDLESQRAKLVDEANKDKERLEQLEAEEENEDDEDDDDTDDGLDVEHDDRDRVPRNGRPGFPAPAAAPIGEGLGLLPQDAPPSSSPSTPSNPFPQSLKIHRIPSAATTTRHEQRLLRSAKIRNNLERRRLHREKQLALLKHDFVMRSLRLFRGKQRIVILDSWVSAGHELFCNVVEPEDSSDEDEEGGGQHDDEDDEDDDEYSDEESSYDEFDEGSDQETDLEDDSDIELSDDSCVGDGEDSFSLEGQQQQPHHGGKVVRMSRSVGNTVDWEEMTHTPRRSTVTINETLNHSAPSPPIGGVNTSGGATVREFLGMSASTPPLQGILSPVPIRSNTPLASILSNEGYKSSNADLPPSSAEAMNASMISSASDNPTSATDPSEPATTTPSTPAPASATSNITSPPTTHSNPILGSAFRSASNSVSTSTNHLNFSLKTKIKTTSDLQTGSGSSTVPPTRSPPPPPSGSSINDKSSVAGMSNRAFGAQTRLEQCFEAVFAEICRLSEAGDFDGWIEKGGGEDALVSRAVRRDLLKQTRRRRRGENPLADDNDTDDDDFLVRFMPPAPENINLETGDVAGRDATRNTQEFYTDDIVQYSRQYGVYPNGQTIINLLLCLFDMLQAVQPRRRGEESTQRRYSSRASNASSSHRNHANQLTRAGTFTSPSYRGFPYTLKDGDLCVSDGFDLARCDKLDGYVAGVFAGIKNVRLVQFLIKTLLVDHEVGVGKRTGKAVVEGMKAVNSGMKGKVRLQ
ncbi:hypothetical protein BCR33DRAFT_713139 [Rhizoclosmatium globosum]|uniref:BTB domain-containing protein n=1 Tax=Rhizoclosmatium globosum TaxID=329046 RepID=A0A1Y2CVF4_9FUNG|nr:hypothetical protein BCR33DRAFT_713139 [Rhizoclosmatium globosum]|eukprot:ORY50325.1 hypothetical protein BCR33DRAFT_713139 [Rhizoclosmatium globosum]